MPFEMADIQRVQEAPKPQPPAPKKGWGTREEHYRRLCLLAMFCRFAYYCKSTKIVPDDFYDGLECFIREIENRDREVMHPNSPTTRVGSDKETDYARSCQDLWYCHGDDPRTFDTIQAVIQKEMDWCRGEWGIQ